MPLTQTTQHPEEALLKLAPPFWGKPRIASLLTAFILEVQRLEDEIWATLEARDLSTANLNRLKVLGKIVGQDRLSFAEADYRTLIEAKARTNISKGETADLVAVCDIIFGAGTYNLSTPAGGTLIVELDFQASAVDLALAEQVLGKVVPAGVAVQLHAQLDVTVDTDWITDSLVTPGAVGATPLWSVRAL